MLLTNLRNSLLRHANVSQMPMLMLLNLVKGYGIRMVM
uniref:HAP2 n=1 Tax=Arundo donax TaxID=35708 RepID=A0A0A9FT51_ARUDO